MSRSMKSHQPQNSDQVDWITPRWILNPLGEFDLDPCTPQEMPWPTAKSRLTREQDGLKTAWLGRVCLNPPFDKASRAALLEKMARHGNGIALVPASTETKWFKDFIWPFATSILFLKERPYFHKPDGARGATNSGCSICLVGYGKQNDAALRDSKLGQYLRIEEQENG